MKGGFSVKKTLSFLLTMFLSLALAFSATAETISINLSTASDAQLAEALDLILAEQKARIKTTISLDKNEITLSKGKQASLTASIEGLPENSSSPKVIWSSSDQKVATVSNGRINALSAGSSTITASITLADGIELSASCKVTVIINITSLSLSKTTQSLQVGDYLVMDVIVNPKTASIQTLSYSSSDSSVATVSPIGVITTKGPGICKITATSTDGSNKSVSCTVKVSSFQNVKSEYRIVSKKGSDFSFKYFGSKNNLKVNISSSAYASTSYSLSNNTLTFSVTPIKSGTFTVTVSDKSDSTNKAQFKIVIDDNATYNTRSYPAINYDGSARYPDTYEGRNASFSGKVLQVIKGNGYNAYRISSKGSYDNVVFVLLLDANQTVPLIEDDRVTVYGTYSGNYTYETVMGAEITIPMVTAERINLK